MSRTNSNFGSIKEDNKSLQAALSLLRQDFDAHNHDGTSSKTFQTLLAETLSTRAISIRKTSYSDSVAGLWMGISENVMKFKLGSATSYLSWDGSAFTAFGGTITGGTVQTAASGVRLVLTGNSIRGYNGANVNLTILSNDTLELNDASGVMAISLNYSYARIGTVAAPITLQTCAIIPWDSSFQNGSAGDYWDNINTHDLTKRGGGTFGSFDAGVELQDGRKVSDTEAILQWTEHPTRKTKYGVPALDYRKAPKDIFVPSPLPRNEDDIPYEIKDEKIVLRPDTDGESVFATISIMLGAIKELSTKVAALEGKDVIIKP